MRKIIVAIILAAALALPTVSFAKQPYDSILPLQDKHEDWKIGDPYHTFCTAWAARLDERVMWVTAAHCVADTGENPLFIGNKPARLVKVDKQHDLALLEGPTVQGLYIGFGDTPTYGTEVIIVGYPGGIGPLITRGYISSPSVEDETYGELSAYDVAVMGGNSGSPVMLPKGNIVVGVLQLGWSPFASPISFGATLKNLRRFLGLEV